MEPTHTATPTPSNTPTITNTPIITPKVWFSGYEWLVKEALDIPTTPGPNLYSTDNVWVDEEGLHMKVVKDEDQWVCSEVSLATSMGYGRYTYHTSGRIDLIAEEPCVVVGISTIDTTFPPFFRQIDMELGRWCKVLDQTNMQYVIQPWDLRDATGTFINRPRFTISLTEEENDLTFMVTWLNGEVTCETYNGHHYGDPPEDTLIYRWIRSGTDVPVKGNEKVRISHYWYDQYEPDEVSAPSENFLLTYFNFVPESALGTSTPTMTPTVTPTGTSTPTPLPTLTIIDLPGDVKMEFMLIPAGNFSMGSDDTGWSNTDEQPVNEVNIDYSFYIGKFEITQAQWLAVMGNWPGTEPSGDCGAGDNYPAYYISWNDCQDYITNLNNLGVGTFRLPSESEWEYACRAGSSTRFYYGDSDCSSIGCGSCDLDNYGWWCGNNGAYGNPDYGSKEAGQLLPNSFGLYDMHGNVKEWCQDWYHVDYNNAPDDGTAWESPVGSERVLRGGYWIDKTSLCRSAARSKSIPDNRMVGFGFRVVMDCASQK